MVTRRAALHLGGTTICGLAGCLDASGQDERSRPTSTETPSNVSAETPPDTPTVTPPTKCPSTETPPGGVSLAVRNRLDESRRVTVSIEQTGDGVVLEETFEIAAGDGVLARDAITEEGDYDIELAMETGTTERWTVTLPDDNEMPLGAYVLIIRIDEEIGLGLLHGDPAPTPPGC